MIQEEIRCAEMVEIVTEWMEGALDDDTRSAVEEHLAICPDCTAYLDQLRATVAVAADLGRPAGDAGTGDAEAGDAEANAGAGAKADAEAKAGAGAKAGAEPPPDDLRARLVAAFLASRPSGD